MLALQTTGTAEQNEAPRDALRAAHLKRDNAALKEEAASRALGKARQLLDEANRRLSNFDSLDDEVAKHRRAGIKAFATIGLRPDDNLPPDLQARTKARAQARERVEAYRASHQELTAELQAATKAREDMQAGVYDAASVVIAAEAELIAVKRQAAQAEVWACDEELAAAATNWVRGVDRPRPVRLTPKTLAIMSAGNVPVLQSLPVASRKQQEVNARWRSYFERLCVDADARLE